MKNILSKALVAVCLTVMTFAAVAQNSFSYQAIIRDGGKALENKTVSLRLSVMTDDSVYYQEKHAVTTNAYGNVSVSVGEGEMLRGSFDAIPWETMQVMMQVEVSGDGTDNYVNMGSMQILPVPYTMYAASTATIIQPKEATEDPIFEVRDSEGNLMFAVYETGVKVFVDDNKNDNESGKAAKSKFAVAGMSAEKGERSLLTINTDGTTVYVDDNTNENSNTNKAAKSKFAVASLSSKGNGDLLTIDGSGSTIYVDQDADGKAAKSKFAVAGHSAKGKKSKNNYSIDNNNSTLYVDFNDNASKTASQVLSIDGGSATFYVDADDNSKAAKSRFAVAGVGANKDVQTAFVIDGSGTVIYIDDLEGDKAAKSTFAVAGQSAQKGNNNFFIIHRDSTRIYVYDEPASVDTATGTVVTPSLTSAFAVTGITKKENMLVVNRDSTIVKIDTYVTEEVQSTTGVVEKVVDDTKPDKVYSTGTIFLSINNNTGYEFPSIIETNTSYAYYHSKIGEYLYLKFSFDDNDEEYRNYWLYDGKIYEERGEYDYGDKGNHKGQSRLRHGAKNDSGKFEVFESRDWNGKGLLMLMERTLRDSGYSVTPLDGTNYFYLKDDPDNYIVSSESNIITGLRGDEDNASGVEIFSKYMGTFTDIIYSFGWIQYYFEMVDINTIDWGNLNEEQYGYTLFGDDINSEIIIAKESEFANGEDFDNEEDAFVNRGDSYRHTLSDIEDMFAAMRDGVSVTVQSGNPLYGSVQISKNKEKYKFGETITISAVPLQGYMFAGWSDGSTANPRIINVINNLDITANFTSIASNYQLVDLGLSVKWANCNLGAAMPSNAGGKYAWGETISKQTFTSETYTLTETSQFQDAATVLLGEDFRMPKADDWQELMDSCIWTFDEDGNATVTSRINNNSILLPIVKYYNDEGLAAPYSLYWSRTLTNNNYNNEYYAYMAMFGCDENEGRIYTRKNLNGAPCYIGLPIRPVANTYTVKATTKGEGVVDVLGSGVYPVGSQVTLTATPAEGAEFIQWNDGVTTNPRIITIGENNQHFTAFFNKQTFKGVEGKKHEQIDINAEVTTDQNLTYNIILDNVKRIVEHEEWCSGMIIHNKNANTELTVKIKLVGNNEIWGDNHGGLKLSGESGAKIKVVFDTESTASFTFGAKDNSTKDLQIQGILNTDYTISIAQGCSFTGIVNGTAYNNPERFFEAAANNTVGESSFMISRENIGSKAPGSSLEVGDIVFCDGSATTYTENLTLTKYQKSAAVAVIFYKGTECSDDGSTRTLGIGIHNSAENGTDGQLMWATYDKRNTNINSIICTPTINKTVDCARTTDFKKSNDILVKNGSNNWTLLCQQDNTAAENAAEYYPAFNWANNYGSTHYLTGSFAIDWYLPSLAEMCYLYRNLETVNNTIESLGGTMIKTSQTWKDDNTCEDCAEYWPSSEYYTSYECAWYINMGNGYLNWHYKNWGKYVCCVREFSDN